MQNKYITNLINIQGILVKKIDSYKNNTIISIETKAKHHICPSCLEKTNKIHDYRNQKIQHINIGDNRLIIILKNVDMFVLIAKKGFIKNILLSKNTLENLMNYIIK